METLLGAGFQPTRKIVLSFGFDEEVSGVYVRITTFSNCIQTLTRYLLMNI